MRIFIISLILIFNFLALESSYGALAYRTKTFSSSNSSTTGVTATEPTGTAENDILFGFFTGDGTLTVTPPTGWTSLGSVSANGITTKLYWIRRGSSAPAYNFAWTSAPAYELSITAWSGAVTSGNPYDVYVVGPAAQRSPANPNCPSVTTTVADTIVIAFGMAYREYLTGGATPPTGYTFVEGLVGGKLAIAYKAKATAGAEDPGAFGNGTATNSDVVEITVALTPAATATPIKRRVISD